MAFSKGNLVPTPVMRSDGHMTTVHKKTASASPAGTARLAATKPSLGTTIKATVHPNDKKMLKVAWSGRSDGANAVASGPGSLLARLGMSLEATDDGADRMSHGDLYEYLKLGIKLPEASYLNSIMPLAEWKNDPKFQSAIPGDLAHVSVWKQSRLVPIEEAVDFLRENGIAPRIAQKMLMNGLSDHHTKGVLSAEELERLFIRFKYQPSVDENKDTNAAVAIDALVDGRLPFDAFNHDFKRALLTDAVDSVYPRKAPRLHPTDLTETDREYFKTNPAQIVPVMAKASAVGSDFSTTYTAMKEFGAEAIEKYYPELLTIQRPDGSFFGIEGAKRAMDFGLFVDGMLKDGERTGEDRTRTNLVIMDGYARKSVTPYQDILEMQDAGASDEKVADLLFEQGLGVEQAKAVVRGDTGKHLAEGWL